MLAYLRENALIVILIVVVAVVGIALVHEHNGTSTAGGKAPVECSIDGNFDNDTPGCVAPGTNHKP